MSKSLADIKIEMAALSPEPRSIQSILEELAAGTGIPMEKMLAALDSAAPDTPELLPDGARVYYTSFPNCGIMVQRGTIAERVEFKGNRLVTVDPDVIAYMDAIADKPGSSVYTKSNQNVSVEVMQMRDDLKTAANKAQTRMVAAGERVG